MAAIPDSGEAFGAPFGRRVREHGGPRSACETPRPGLWRTSQTPMPPVWCVVVPQPCGPRPTPLLGCRQSALRGGGFEMGAAHGKRATEPGGACTMAGEQETRPHAVWSPPGCSTQRDRGVRRRRGGRTARNPDWTGSYHESPTNPAISSRSDQHPGHLEYTCHGKGQVLLQDLTESPR